MTVQTRRDVQISVITVSLNAHATLAMTLQSVLGQSFDGHEILVVDGGSTDGTVEIIREHASGLAWWVSEPDQGIADAMNKGIARARGEWLLFLHADDYLHASDALERAVTRLADADILACAIEYREPDRSRVVRSRGFGAWMNFKTGFWHQGLLIRRSLFDRIGLYDPAFRIAMDYEWLLRAYRAGAHLQTAPELVLSTMRHGGISSRKDWPTLAHRLAEERAIHARHAAGPWMKLLYAAYWSVYPAYKRVISL
jgi:glycosyltransferase involved in cell wall biosynthesis